MKREAAGRCFLLSGSERLSALNPDPHSAPGDNCLSGINREINEFISGGEFSSCEQHLRL